MRYRILAVVAALMLLAAACGDSASDDTSSPATTAAPATTATPATTAAPATTEASGGDVAGPSVALGTSGLGEFLTDGEGNTLYLFLPDGQGESTCYDQCEANWPVFSGEGAGAGVDAALLGTVTRTDGNPQTTYNGWPLYYFAADAAPGDTNGQGVGDVWFVVTPTGDPIGAPQVEAAGVVVGTSGLGEFLTDGEGNTLYLFLPDGQGESTCYDQCEANWPVFSGEGAGAGVDAGLLGTFTRTDGNPQTTYNGWPLYYFAADAAPGDTNGQGVGDVWFVVTPTGDPIQ